MSNEQLQEAANEIRNRATRDAVSFLIDSGRINANDTVAEKSAPQTDWERIAADSIAGLLANEKHPRAVVAWFAKRGISA